MPYRPQVRTGFDIRKRTPNKTKFAPVSASAILSRHTPSIYQKNIIDAVLRKERNIIVEAKAGSAKTTTLAMCVAALNRAGVSPKEIIVCAFTKAIEQELSARLTGLADIKTTFGIGRRAVVSGFRRQYELDEFKYERLAREAAKKLRQKLLVTLGWQAPSEFNLSYAIERLTKQCQLSLVDPAEYEVFEQMADHYSIDAPGRSCIGDFIAPVIAVLQEGQEMVVRGEPLSYGDMVYAPYAFNLPLLKYRYVFVDEAQDTSGAQKNLVSGLIADDGIAICLGDRYQACFGFAGAGTDSMDELQRTLNAEIYPLDISYRCPKAVIELAQKIVPSIRHAPDALEGIIDYVDPKDLIEKVREGDILIGRKTAPLIEWCLEFIKARKPARVKGKDVGGAILGFIRQVADHKDFRYDRFAFFLNQYMSLQIARLRDQPGGEYKLEVLRDRARAALICFETFHECRTAPELIKEVDNIFTDDRVGITFSTIHRIKGLEAARVFIIKPEDMPMKWKGQQDHEFQQEMNLIYIAYTRVMYGRGTDKEGELYFVEPRKEE